MILYQPDRQRAMTMSGDRRHAPRALREAADSLEDSAEDILPTCSFPKEHRRPLHSTNTVERLHLEIKLRTVIGIFPQPGQLTWFGLQEGHDEWQVAERRYFSIES
jgi:putative transposase